MRDSHVLVTCWNTKLALEFGDSIAANQIPRSHCIFFNDYNPIIKTMNEPPIKRIKSGQDFMDLICDCYDLKFNSKTMCEEEKQRLRAGVKRIRETLEQTKSSSDITFGDTRTNSKITWGKCLALLLEDGSNSLTAIGILTGKLSPGGGVL